MNKALSALKIIALAILILFFAVWASSRWLITYFANAQFERDNTGMALSIDSMSLNLFGPSLEMGDLTLTLPNDNIVSFESLNLELQYLPLFFQEVSVETFQIDGLNVRYHLPLNNDLVDNNTLPEDSAMPEDPTITNKDATSEEQNNTQESEPPKWLVLVQNLHINDLQLDANIEGNQITTTQTHFHLNNTQINLEQSSLTTEIDFGLSVLATLAKNAEQENIRETKVQIDQFDFVTSVKVNNFVESPEAFVENFKISTKRVNANIPDINANIDAIKLEFSALNVKDILNIPAIALTPDLSFNIDKINAVHQPSNATIADINNISLNQVGANALLTPDAPRINVHFDTFNVQDILLLEYDPAFAVEENSETLPQTTEQTVKTQTSDEIDTDSVESTNNVTLFTLADFNLSQLNTQVSEQGTHVELSSISFDEINVNALLHALPTFVGGSKEAQTEASPEAPHETLTKTEVTDENAPSNSEIPVQASAQASVQTEDEVNEQTHTEPTDAQPKLTFAVGNISHAKPVKIHLLDKSVFPEFEQKIVIDRLSVKQLESNFLNMEANVNASINGYSQLLVDVNPNTAAKQKDNMLVDVKLSNFDLVSVSPYVKKAADMSIERGNIDLNSIINVNKVGWKGDIHLVLKSLGVTTVNTSPDVSLEDESVDFIPLNVLLDKISDSKGHLDIDMPIEGKNGELSGVTTGIIRNVVEIITTEAAKSYLVQTFVPYSNIVSIAQYAGNKMFEINIEDLEFPNGAYELPEQERKVFDAYAKLIKEQDSLVITVCPVSTWADIGIKPPVNKSNTAEPNKELAEMKLTEKQLSKLYELAKKREVYFKDQLIAKKADMSRLVSCATKISKRTDRSGYLGFTTKG